MKPSTFLLTTALILAAATAAQAQQPATPPSKPAAPAAAAPDPCAQEQQDVDHGSIAFSEQEKTIEKRQEDKKEADARLKSWQQEVANCEDEANRYFSTPADRESYCSEVKRRLSVATKAQARAAELASRSIGPVYKARQDDQAALDKCRVNAAKKATDDAKAKIAAAKKAEEDAKARAAIAAAKQAEEDAKAAIAVKKAIEIAKAAIQPPPQIKPPEKKDDTQTVQPLGPPPQPNWDAPTLPPKSPAPLGPPKQPDWGPQSPSAATTTATPVGPPPQPDFTRLPGGGLTCNYRNSAGSWSFTTFDPEFLKSGCPTIPPGYAPVSPAGTPAPPPDPADMLREPRPPRTTTAAPLPPATLPGGAGAGPSLAGGGTTFGLRPDSRVMGAPLPPATIQNPPNNIASTQPSAPGKTVDCLPGWTLVHCRGAKDQQSAPSCWRTQDVEVLSKNRKSEYNETCTAATKPGQQRVAAAPAPLPPAAIAPPVLPPAATDSVCTPGSIPIQCDGRKGTSVCSKPDEVDMHLKDYKRRGVTCTAGKPADMAALPAKTLHPKTLPPMAMPMHVAPKPAAPIHTLAPAALPAPMPTPHVAPAPQHAAPPPVIATPAPAAEPVNDDDEEEEPAEEEEDAAAPAARPGSMPAQNHRQPRGARQPAHQPHIGAVAPAHTPRIRGPRIHVGPRITHRTPHVQPRVAPRIAHRPQAHINRVAPRIAAAPRIQVHRPVFRPAAVHRPAAHAGRRR